MKNRIIRATAAQNGIRAFIANTTEMVEEARKIHQASPVAIAALGRVLTATSMMGLMLKDEKHKLTVKINGKGPLGSIVVVGNAHGHVKGYVANPQIEGSEIRPGKLNVGQAVGKDGEIVVIKDLGLKEPYIGSYPLITGEIAEDFAHYFLYSEQQPSIVGLGVLIDVDYKVKAAGGLIIQVMPNVEEDFLVKLEKKISTIESVTSLMEKGMGEEEILDYLLGEMNPQILEQYEVNFVCDCSVERLEGALISLGKNELMEIIEEDEGAELICHFCNKKYYFDQNHLLDLLNQI